MNNIISSSELLKLNTVDINSTADTFSNQSFWHYTTESRIHKILSNKQFWVGNIFGMNDKNEKTFHSNDAKRVHCLCFCNTNTEKIPMWYLYSGIIGDGMRLGLTPKNMMDFIKSINMVHPIENGEWCATPLTIGIDFDLQYGWVYYRKDEHTINYKRKWYTVDDGSRLEKKNYFIKDYPWEYEKEFRIVLINKTNKEYEHIAIDIPEFIIEKLRYGFAPERNNNGVYPVFLKNVKSKQILSSKLGIEMNLLERNKECIIDNIEKVVAGKDINIKKAICNRIMPYTEKH